MELSAVSVFRRIHAVVRGRDVGFLATAMSPRWFFMDFYVYPPLILLALAVAMDGTWIRVAGSLGLVAGGLGIWTLAEYLIHRFGFHHVTGLKEVHLAHHAEPEGLHGSPTVVTVLVFAVLAFCPLWYGLGVQNASALTAGVMLGYLAYVGVHYVVHHAGSLGSGWIRRHLYQLIRAHAVHHHHSDSNFGVTTLLWDRVFGTKYQRGKR